MMHMHGRVARLQGFASVSILTVLLVAVGPAAMLADAQTRVLVADSNGSAVSVVDPANTSIDPQSIAVGLAPSHVVVSKDGTRAFVANTGSNSISVIDTATQAVLDTIDVGDQPSGLAVALGGRVYVMGAAGTLRAFETQAGTNAYALADSVFVGGTDGKIAVTPDGHFVYVVSGTVSVVENTGTTLVAHTPFVPEVTPSPGIANFGTDIAISSTGLAYVSVTTYSYDFLGFRAGGGIAVIDTSEATDVVASMISLFSLPGSIAFSADGSQAFVGIDAYWADTLYGAGFLPGRWVAAIDTGTQAVGWIDLGAAGTDWSLIYRPAGLAVSADKTAVFVAIPTIHAIARIDAATNLVSETVLVGGAPTGVALADPSFALRLTTVDAVDDTAPSPFPALAAGLAVKNVLANDTVVGGGPAALSNVTLAVVSSTSAGVTLDSNTGAVWIAEDAEVGSHSLTYEICETGHADNCDRATVTLTVRAAYGIVAGEDRATATPGTSAIANVLANDSLGDAPAGPATVALSLVASGGDGISLDIATGAVLVAADAPSGTHALGYRICEIASPKNCADGDVTVTVVPRDIHAESDNATSSRAGGRAIANVLANDMFDGATATLARVTLSAVSSTDAGVTLDAASGSVSVARDTAAGLQTLVYLICETASPGNCSEGTANVTVSPYVVKAVADSARASSKNAGTAIANVLSNDTIGGAPATLANVKLSLISMSPANSRIQLNANGSVEVLTKAGSGLYSLLYQICETGNAGNCAGATVSLDLSGK
jgi:YVTN family beta-propeller protein